MLEVSQPLIIKMALLAAACCLVCLLCSWERLWHQSGPKPSRKIVWSRKPAPDEFACGGEDCMDFEGMNAGAQHSEPVELFFEELGHYFEAARRRRCKKEEVLSSIIAILQKYPMLKASSHQDTIINLIVVQCRNICSLSFSRDEVEKRWMKEG